MQPPKDNKKIHFEIWEIESQTFVQKRIPQCVKTFDSAEGKQQHKECIYYVLRAQHRSLLFSVYTAVTPEASGAICSAVSTSHIKYCISSASPHVILLTIPTQFLVHGHYSQEAGLLPKRNWDLKLITNKFNL